MKKQNEIIRTYLLITGLFTFSAALIWGINTLFLMKAGMSIFQVFVVNAIYSASMAVFEIPTGVFADTLGRRKSFLASTIVLAIGTFGYVAMSTWQNNFILFSLMSIVLGLAFTFYSGAVEAWVVDALYYLKYEEEIDGVFARGATISNIATLFGTILGGYLGSINLSIPYIMRGGIQLLVFVLAMIFMKDIGYKTKELKIKKIPYEMKKIAKSSIEYGVKNISIRYLMFTTVIFSSFMMWGWYAWQPYFLELFGDTGAVWIAGIISALLSLSQVAGSLLVRYLLPKFKKRTNLLIPVFLIQALAIIAVGVTNSFYGAVTFFLCFSFTLGVAMPIKQGYLHKLIPSEQRATIVSFDSLVGSVGSVFGQIGYGYIGEKISIGSGYIVGGIVHLLIVPSLVLLNKRNDKEDLTTIQKENPPLQ